MRKANVFFSIYLFGHISLIVFCPAIGRCQDLPELPYMYVDQKESKARIDYLENNKIANNLSKGEILDAIIQETNPAETHCRNYMFDISFFRALFAQLIVDNGNTKPEGLNIYLGAFNPDQVPNNNFSTWALRNEIVLIFSGPTTTSQKFYVYGPGNKLTSIDEKYKNWWTDNYVQNVIYHKDPNGKSAGLINTIFPADEENHPGEILSKDSSDTRSIFYKWEYITGFLDTEVTYQNTIHQNANYINRIKISLASYSLAGLERGNHICELSRYFRNRLHLLFGFMHSNSNYEISDNGRNPSKDWCINKKTKLAITGGDNGQLCPPYNCPR